MGWNYKTNTTIKVVKETIPNKWKIGIMLIKGKEKGK